MRHSLAAGALIVLALLVSCGGEGQTTEPATPSSTTTPGETATGTSTPPATSEPTSCAPPLEPAESARFQALAREVDTALAAQDADFFLSRVLEQELSCVSAQQVGPCEGEEPGTQLKGLRVATYRTDYWLLSPLDDFRQFLADHLGSSGSPGLSPYALVYFDAQSVSVMTTAPLEPASGQKPEDAWVFTFRLQDGDWRLTQVTWVQPDLIDDWLSEEALSVWERCVHWVPWQSVEALAGEGAQP